MTRLSKYFTIQEMSASELAVRKNINNDPDQESLENLKSLCLDVLDPVRELLRAPIHINSGYRNKDVNKAIGGASTSQHVKGQAADIVPQSIDLKWAYEQIMNSSIEFDQLIFEFGQWIHISYVKGGKNRRECLRAYKANGKTVYQSFF